MADHKLPERIEAVVLNEKERAILEQLTGGNWKKYGRVAMAALSGIPWVGSVLSAAATLSAEKEQGITNKLLFLWVQEHELKLRELLADMRRVFERLEIFGIQTEERIESTEYLNLVRKTFRVWDGADTTEKRESLRKLITNAAGMRVVDDDVVRLFVEFMERFHELHFQILRLVYQNPGISSYDIATEIFGEIPRDDSAKADLFKFLFHELQMADVMRQPRESDADGQWRRRVAKKKAGPQAKTLKSPFNDDQQVLTELGKQFMRYIMDDLDPQLEAGNQ